jgi:tRNA-2-methylthio-N6-dimethylallyladenosine synthase
MKYYFWVLGCAMNYSDAERIATVLSILGYEKTEVEEEADLIVTIACSVRQHAIDRIYGKAKDWQRRKAKNPTFKTVLTGCVLEKDRAKMAKVFDLIFEIEDLGKLPGLLGEAVAEDKVEEMGRSGEYLGIAPAYESSFRAYVPIMTGCNNFCTYCAVPYTRGREKSRSQKEIILEVSGLVEKGFKEITLLGQNVNSYEFGFVELLAEIDKIPGDYRVYFYSNHPKDMSEGLINLMPTLKHFPAYIHLPLQSGNDEIIRAMNRHYSKESYLELVEKIRTAMPEVALTTDIIVGFPGEGESELADTVEVMEAAKFDMAFLAQYSSRPGTKAAKLEDDVNKEEKKRREKILLDVLSKTAKENNERLVGTPQKVLVDGEKNGKYFGRTAGYKVVEIKTDQALELGQFIDVEVKSATAWKLLGIVLP